MFWWSFEVKVGMHQGSVPSPLLFSIVMDVVMGGSAVSVCRWYCAYGNYQVWARETVDGVESKFVGQRIEGECREENADGRWRSSVRAWCMAVWSMQQGCSAQLTRFNVHNVWNVSTGGVLQCTGVTGSLQHSSAEEGLEHGGWGMQQ